jgi:hypothetical protein
MPPTTPPNVFSFLLDSAGVNVTAQYEGIELSYMKDGNKELVPRVQLLSNGAPTRYGTNTTVVDTGFFMNIAGEGISSFDLRHKSRLLGTFQVSVRAEGLFTKKYIVEKAIFNNQVLISEPNRSYLFIVRLP